MNPATHRVFDDAPELARRRSHLAKLMDAHAATPEHEAEYGRLHVTARSDVDRYLSGFSDGEQWANKNYLWFGAAIGIVLSAIVVFSVLAYVGFLR